MANPNTPVLVGVGQFGHRIESLDEALEPVDMMLEACIRAEKDTGVGGVLQQAQSVRVVRGMWRYNNPAKLIAGRIGAPGAQTVGTLVGGNQNQALMNQTAASILAGELDLALITGAENGYSSGKARRAGVALSERDAPGQYNLLFGSAQKPEHHEFEVAKGIRQAIQVYPMYDNAIRHHRGETINEHLVRISELWSRFNDVAQGNPHAWIRQKVSAEEIRTPAPTNRRVSFPYTKLMNANNSVDMAAALIVCSTRKAKQLGIAEELWVYPHAGAEGHDRFSASVRDNFYTSPGIRFVGRRVLELAQIEASDLAFVDLYSCFPSAVQVAAMELGLAENRSADGDRGTDLRGRAHQQLRHARHRPNDGASAGASRQTGANYRQRWQSVQTCTRCLRERAIGTRVSLRERPGRDRCATGARMRVGIQGQRNGGILYRDVRCRRTGHGACRLPDS